MLVVSTMPRCTPQGSTKVQAWHRDESQDPPREPYNPRAWLPGQPRAAFLYRKADKWEHGPELEFSRKRNYSGVGIITTCKDTLEERKKR